MLLINSNYANDHERQSISKLIDKHVDFRRQSIKRVEKLSLGNEYRCRLWRTVSSNCRIRCEL